MGWNREGIRLRREDFKEMDMQLTKGGPTISITADKTTVVEELLYVGNKKGDFGKIPRGLSGVRGKDTGETL